MASSEQIGLDLASNGTETVSGCESEVSEEDSHEDGAPEDLVNGNLGGNGLGISSLDLGVEPVVEVVTRGSVVDESEYGEGDETPDVKDSRFDNEKL